MKALATFLGLAAMIAAAVAFLFGTFPTFRYVDAKDDAVERKMQVMQETLNIIDQRTWEMRGREGIPPRHLSQEP